MYQLSQHLFFLFQVLANISTRVHSPSVLCRSWGWLPPALCDLVAGQVAGRGSVAGGGCYWRLQPTVTGALRVTSGLGVRTEPRTWTHGDRSVSDPVTFNR